MTRRGARQRAPLPSGLHGWDGLSFNIQGKASGLGELRSRSWSKSSDVASLVPTKEESPRQKAHTLGAGSGSHRPSGQGGWQVCGFQVPPSTAGCSSRMGAACTAPCSAALQWRGADPLWLLLLHVCANQGSRMLPWSCVWVPMGLAQQPVNHQCSTPHTWGCKQPENCHGGCQKMPHSRKLPLATAW